MSENIKLLRLWHFNMKQWKLECVMALTCKHASLLFEGNWVLIHKSVFIWLCYTVSKIQRAVCSSHQHDGHTAGGLEQMHFSRCLNRQHKDMLECQMRRTAYAVLFPIECSVMMDLFYLCIGPNHTVQGWHRQEHRGVMSWPNQTEQTGL